jgi:hypothetical protein
MSITIIYRIGGLQQMKSFETHEAYEALKFRESLTVEQSGEIIGPNNSPMTLDELKVMAKQKSDYLDRPRP